MMSSSSEASSSSSSTDESSTCIYQCIKDLCNNHKRLLAMLELQKYRNKVADMGLWIWHSFGAVSALLQEITRTYTAVSQNNIGAAQSRRVCAAIGLLQSVGAHPLSCLQLLRCQILEYLLPLLRMTPQTPAVEQVRLSVLGVISDMLKLNHVEVVTSFLGTELMPILLRQLELGSVLAKALCGLILCRIFDHDVALEFVCHQDTRLVHVIHVLGCVVYQLTLEPEVRVLKHVVRAYLRLANHRRANEMLQSQLPEQLRNGFFCNQTLTDYEEAPQELDELNLKIDLGCCIVSDQWNKSWVNVLNDDYVVSR